MISHSEIFYENIQSSTASKLRSAYRWKNMRLSVLTLLSFIVAEITAMKISFTGRLPSVLTFFFKNEQTLIHGG